MSLYDKAAQDKYRATHKEVLKMRNKAYYNNNIDKERARSRDRYSENLGQQRDYHTEYMKSIRDTLAFIKVKRGCVDCGYNENSVALDFDHVDGNKIWNLQAATSLDKALIEIEKCEVRCSNCHRVITHKRRKEARSKKELLADFQAIKA